MYENEKMVAIDMTRDKTDSSGRVQDRYLNFSTRPQNRSKSNRQIWVYGECCFRGRSTPSRLFRATRECQNGQSGTVTNSRAE